MGHKSTSNPRVNISPRNNFIRKEEFFFFHETRKKKTCEETMVNMKLNVAIMTLVVCLAYSAKIDDGADREKREDSADKELAAFKNLAKFEALNQKMRRARDQIRQDASCDDCQHCPKCKTHCPGGPNCHHCHHCFGAWTTCCVWCGDYC